MKKMKKILAIALATVMTIAMAVPAFAATSTTDANPTNWTTDVTVTAASETTTGMNAYKFIEPAYNSTTGQVTWAFTSWAKTAIQGETSCQDDNGNFDSDKAMNVLGVRFGADNNGTLIPAVDDDDKDAKKKVLTLIAAAVPSDATAVAGTADSANTTYTFGLTPGTYVVKATDSGAIYNPMMISADLTTDATGKYTGIRANGTVGKYATVGLDKVQIDDNDDEVKGDTKAIGDTVNYKVTTVVPNFDFDAFTAAQTTPTFTITDTLSNGFDAPKAADVTVTVGNRTISNAVSVGGKVITVTLGDKISATDIGEDVVVEYSAKLNQNAIVGFDGNKNSATLTYSRSTNKTQDDLTTPPKETFTYTFAIDGNVFGNGEVIDHIVKKTGVGTWETSDTDPIASASTALAGAVFTLYSDSNCTQKVGAANLKGNSDTATSSAAGMINFEGLNANTVYYLKETSAPDGYSINTEVHSIEFVVDSSDIDAKGQLLKYVAKIDGTPVATATYTAATPATDTTGAVPASVSVSYTNKGTAADGITTIETTEIKNTKLAALPSTGGIGTTIFTVAGCAIVAIAGGLLIVSRKRKNA